jgi:hypothetical protein
MRWGWCPRREPAEEAPWRARQFRAFDLDDSDVVLSALEVVDVARADGALAQSPDHGLCIVVGEVGADFCWLGARLRNSRWLSWN